ncbi:MAG: SDR family NAD(P)-dependent oxidoreductase [Candidatus Hinthialibacter antarcticus]|nr:SDR family NAD(P)-dependent oxidoreductase [Candidatus Hinthialibacter antarcticus]
MTDTNQAAMLDPKRLMKALDDAASKLQAMQRRRSEPIAVVGMECRFPGADDGAESYWRMLRDGRCAVSDIPAQRWDADAFFNEDPEAPGTYYTKKGGFLRDVDLFDAKRFKISPNEARNMDPQQRLLLEVSWRALEHAGMKPESLRGSKTGVFIGATYNEYAELISRSQTGVNAYYGSGNALNAAAGRLAFTYGLHGPCMTIDTACSSSLAALHAACASLRLGDSEVALAGGVNLMLTPTPAIALCRARMLSPDGLCKTFDASANGYVRGEGCAVVVLKRASDARRDGDPILALVRGSAMNHDGPSSGFTVPNGRAQEALIQQALENAKVKSYQIHYVEAHGTGTALGDPIEIQSIANTLSKGRDSENPVRVGSVKTNIGHLEAAAGMAGLIKSILILQNGLVPPHLHFKTPNPHIDWAGVPVRVTAQQEAFPTGVCIGVSSFGASGTNCHVVLSAIEEEYSPKRASLPATVFERKRYWVEEKTQTLPLELGDAESLLRRLQSVGTFTNEEQKMLPAFVEAMQQLMRAPQANDIDDLFYELNWAVRARKPNANEPLSLVCGGALMQQAAPLLESCTRGNDIENYLQGLAQLETLACAYIGNALLDLGFRLDAGECLEEKTIDILPQHRRLLRRLLNILVEDGWLVRNGEAWTLKRKIEFVNPQATVEQLLKMYPEAQAEITVFDRCARNLAGVLRGEVDPLPLLFPQGGEVSAARLYQDSPGATVMNRLVQQAVSGALEGLAPGQTVRILEIGAGTGGTTAYILSHLPGYQVEYTYTDISPAFFQQAREKFSEYDFVEYKTLDIERDVQAQGFSMGEYDIVIAANVVHATKDLSETLSKIHHLLAPGGVVALYEGVGPVRLLDLIFGLTEGWWRFKDVGLRGAHPLISTRQWRELFQAREFVDCCDLTPQAGLLSNQSVLLARKEVSQLCAANGAWLLIHNGGALADELQAQLKTRGGDVISLKPSASDAQVAAAFQSSSVIRGVVFVPGYEDCIDDDWTAEDVIAQNKTACESILTTLQALAAADLPSPPQLNIITSNAVAVTAEDPLAQLHLSTLWGLRRVIAQEHPEWRPRSIDLERGDPQALLALVHELTANDDGDEIAYRNGVRYETRLDRLAPASKPNEIIIRDDAAYVITGGLGGLGLLIAEWLLERGAKRIVLLGRNAPRQDAQQKIDQWNRDGAKVKWQACDVADEAQIKLVLQAAQENGCALKGVIHAAGALDDGMLLRQTWDRFESVMNAKVKGAWNLHRQTRNLSLDFFVLFSTTTAVFGSPGQSNHAAANVFLDELAAYRRASGLPAMSINWGPWGQVGAVVEEGVEERLKSKGVAAMSPETGLRCFERAMRINARQVAAAVIDWAQWPDALMRRPFYETLRVNQQAGVKEAKAELVDLQSMPPAQKEAYLHETIARLVQEILGLDADEKVALNQGFFDMGMDSLSAVELRNQLHRAFGLNLPPTIAFNHPSVAKLSKYILSKQDEVKPETPRAPVAQETAASTPDNLDQLSEDELGALLDQELDQAEERHLR